MGIRKYIEEQTPLKVVGIVFLIIIIGMIIFVKFLGAYNENNVERGGYCFLNYGEEWIFNIREGEYLCDKKNSKEFVKFSEQEFKDYCPKEKLISLHFFNECFKSAPKNRDYIDIGK